MVGIDIKEALLQYNAAMEVLENAEQLVQIALAAIKESAQGSTITVDGVFFQVRARKDRLYLCELSGRPRGRPKGSKNRKTVASAGLNLIEPVEHANGNGFVEADSADFADSAAAYSVVEDVDSHSYEGLEDANESDSSDDGFIETTIDETPCLHVG